MLAVKHARDDAGPEATRGVERATRVVDADELSDEEREADANGGYKGRYLTKKSASIRKRSCLPTMWHSEGEAKTDLCVFPWLT